MKGFILACAIFGVLYFVHSADAETHVYKPAVISGDFSEFKNADFSEFK